MLKLEKTTTQKTLVFGALTAVALFMGMGDAFANDSLLTSTDTLAEQAINLPKIITGLAMPVGIFMMILGGLGLIKLGKEPNAENMRTCIFKFVAGALCLALSWVVPFITNTLGLSATGTVDSAASEMDSDPFN